MLQGINGDSCCAIRGRINGGPGMMIRMPPPPAPAPTREAQALRNPRAEFARFALAILLTSPPSMPLEFTYGGEAEARTARPTSST